MKIKLTKGELKKQRDALKAYERYLPTLQLKKQQLQIEILRQNTLLEEKRKDYLEKRNAALQWAGLFSERGVDIKPFIKPKAVVKDSRNIAGTELPVFVKADFAAAEYDLFSTPLWVDSGIDRLRALVSTQEEMNVIEEGVSILRAELRTTTQRVNLFEKVKIPEAEEAIRVIKIYVGDQMANAVGRSKIAKRKIELVESLAAAGGAL